MWTEADSAVDVERVGYGAGFVVSKWYGGSRGGGVCNGGGGRGGWAGIGVLDYAKEKVVSYYCCCRRAAILDEFGFHAKFFAFWDGENLGVWWWSWWRGHCESLIRGVLKGFFWSVNSKRAK